VIDFGSFDPLPLAGGGELETVIRDLGEPMALVGPEGWLDAFEAGQLVAFSRQGREVSVTAVDEVGDGHREAAALAAAADAWVPEGGGEEETPLVLDAVAFDPSAFRTPVPPVSELLAAAGFE